MDGPLSPPSCVITALNATKNCNQVELDHIFKGVEATGFILRGGDKLVVLGVLHKILHPMGYQLRAWTDDLPIMSTRAMEEGVSEKVDLYVDMLKRSARRLEDQGVSLEVKITAGFAIKLVVLQEVASWNASWVVIDWYLRRDLGFYLKQISFKIAIILHSMSLEVLRPWTRDPHNIEHILFYSVSKPVLMSNDHDSKDMEYVFSYRNFPSSNGSSENSVMRNMTMPSSSAYRSNEDETSMDIGASYELQESGQRSSIYYYLHE
ncbi:hypothetical protein I3842_16G018000 [Carya illinoinensis]|uniref:Uncharacterized protein n=1 Tax=Carya illinoinensis TaxID=32201 RepID=A0A922D0S8_CARIL|nr:hypothetical protein I3842_16G018000 [Carya illinoinensis]